MTLNLSNGLASATVATLLFLPAAALAQPRQAPASPPAEATKPAAGQSSPSAGHPVSDRNATERVEQRIKELHAQLRITADERPQWDQFAQVMRENARDMDQAWLQRAGRYQSMNAVQNMQSYEQIAEEHAQHVQKLVPAFQNLYNAMPDQQKQLADQVFRAKFEKHAQHAMRTGRADNG